MAINRRAFELGQMAGRSQARSVQDRETPAEMGKKRASGAISLRGDEANNDRISYPLVYVRLYGVDTELRVATCVNVGTEPGLNVMVEKNAQNEYRVTRLDDVKAAAAKGQQAGDRATPDKTGTQRDLLPERNGLWGRLKLAEPGTLKVTADPFLYVDTNGGLQVFNPDAMPAFNLTTTLPAADGGGNDQQRYVFMTFNPSATAPALVAHEGAAQLASLPLDLYGYADIDMSSAQGHYPLGPVRLQTGDTSLSEDRFNMATAPRGQPGRLLLQRISASEGGSSLDAVMLSGDGFPMVDADGNYMVRS